ncbi:PREDICTED: uncharacterized protein LOC109581346 [Amphimedon queenslandica]|uniref:ZU5 domain-containing protein n=1 Tax=Amphimedon queenslandica TaxID=400682 RepID=A0AAN0J2L1_AMPQE|nr:PREDICTED: uncharacterized protein LOC109581346 [Amphimedon queenslandica]|eukprot:XP_019850961.1 PREDICTED: uncharacterized protein LOC109581346 [Amphimedon queenslandica]
MSVIECTHTMISKWSFDVVPFNLYTNKLQEIILETADHFYLEDCSAEVQSQPQNNEKLQQLTEKQESQLKEVELQLEYLQKMVQKTQEELKASEQELKKLNLEEIKKKAMIELLQNSFQNQCNQQHDPSFRKQLASFFSFDQKKKRSGVKIEELVEKSMNKYLREYGLLMPEVKSCREVAVQCDYLIRQTDLFDSSVTIAGQERFHLNENSSSFYWEEFGFKLQCPCGAVSEDTEVTVKAIVKGCFDLPRGTELVSAVYAISVSKALLKPLVIELEHCVDLRNTSQTDCLKFVRAPLKPPNAYQFSIVEGGSFSVGNRYGCIERDEFCALGIAHVAEMSNGETTNGGGNEGGTQTQGTNNDSQEQANGDTQTPSDSENEARENSEEASPSIINTPPNDAMESIEPNSHNHDYSTPRADNNAPSGDMLYTGLLYYEQKEVGYRRIRYWYSVVRDLQVLKQYLKKRQASNVEHDDVADLFKFIQPNGTLQLILKPPQRESGWTVDPDREPMELYQSRVDLFPSDPSYATCSLSVYAKPGTAQEPLHCSIELIGIDPSRIVYINASPPPPSSMIDSTTGSNSSTASISQTRRETEEGTCRSDIAYGVMTECTGMIKERLDLNTLVDKYGSIERIQFSLYGIVAEMSNGNNSNGESTPSDTDSEYGTPTGSDNDDDPPKASGHVSDSTELLCKQPAGTSPHSPLQNGTILPGEVLYTGMLYHLQRDVATWTTKYTVVRDLEVLRKYLRDNFPHAEQDDIDAFKFKQPEGILQLQLDFQQQPVGWSVHPRKDPMELHQSLVDKFDPLYSSFSMSVYAKPVAQDPLHFPIKLTGINPEMIIYINRSPPSSNSSTSRSSTRHSITEASLREKDFEPHKAAEVMRKHIPLIIRSQISLTTFAIKALSRQIINRQERDDITDTSTGESTDKRMNKLLELVAVAIQFKGAVFGDFLNILREENNVRADTLVSMLVEAYEI